MARDRRLQRALDIIKLHIHEVDGEMALELLDLAMRVTGRPIGAIEVATKLGVEVANLKWQKIKARWRVSNGKIPVYLPYDVEQELKRRGRKAAAGE